MRATSFAMCMVFLCFMNNVACTFAEFLGNLPSEIGSAFSSAWQTIKDAIKTPVRIKRLGPGGRRKTTLKTTTIPGPPPVTTELSSQFTEELRVASKIINKLELPLLPTPVWRSFDEWNGLHRHRYMYRKKVGNKTHRSGSFDSFRRPSPRVMTFDEWTSMQRDFRRKKNLKRSQSNTTCSNLPGAW